MINLRPKQRCPKCKMLFWKKHTCQKDKRASDFLSCLGNGAGSPERAYELDTGEAL